MNVKQKHIFLISLGLMLQMLVFRFNKLISLSCLESASLC